MLEEGLKRSRGNKKQMRDNPSCERRAPSQEKHSADESEDHTGVEAGTSKAQGPRPEPDEVIPMSRTVRVVRSGQEGAPQ
jgi:hypothetical protein